MKKILAFILAAFFVVFSPISAYASTTPQMMMYSVSPRTIILDGAQIYYTGFLYNSDLLRSMASTSLSSQIFIPDDMLGEYFTGSSSYRRTNLLSQDYTAKDFNYVKYSVELRDSDTFGLSPADIEISFGTLRFALRNNKDSYINFTSNDLSHISYQFAYESTGLESDVYSYENEKPLNKSSLTGTIATPLDQSDISFKAQFPTSSEVNGSTITYVKGLKINFYFKTDRLFDWLGTNAIDAFIFGFSNSPYCYFSVDDLGMNGDISNPQDKQDQEELVGGLNNINTSITNGLSNVVNSVVQMGNQAWQGAQQTVQAVTQMTQQLNTAIDQQRQDILEGLGLLGDDLDSSLSNVKTEITNIGSSITNKLESTTESITNKIESTTETITNTIETKVDQVTTAVDNVKQSVTEVKQSILDLPNKIKDMLLGLIVPDSQTMADKYSEFSQLLEQKLGVIYQIPMMLFDFFDTIVNAATTPQSTLTLPAFRLPWIDGSQLTIWNSMEYKIIPDGLEVLSDLIRTVTSMTVVVLTFNSVKQAYERFLRS